MCSTGKGPSSFSPFSLSSQWMLALKFNFPTCKMRIDHGDYQIRHLRKHKCYRKGMWWNSPISTLHLSLWSQSVAGPRQSPLCYLERALLLVMNPGMRKTHKQQEVWSGWILNRTSLSVAGQDEPLQSSPSIRDCCRSMPPAAFRNREHL